MSLQRIHVDGESPIAPRRTAFTEHFWVGLEDGRFLTTRCDECGRLTFPPREFCPGCWGVAVRWEELSGLGTLYARTVIHAAPSAFIEELPYEVGIVDLEEGVRIVTRLQGEHPRGLDIPVAIATVQYGNCALFAAVPRPANSPRTAKDRNAST